MLSQSGDVVLYFGAVLIEWIQFAEQMEGKFLPSWTTWCVCVWVIGLDFKVLFTNKIHSVDPIKAQLQRGVDPELSQCWDSVGDSGPTFREVYTEVRPRIYTFLSISITLVLKGRICHFIKTL